MGITPSFGMQMVTCSIIPILVCKSYFIFSCVVLMAVILALAQNFFSSLVQNNGKSLVPIIASNWPPNCGSASVSPCSISCFATSCGSSGGVSAGSVGAIELVCPQMKDVQ